MYVKNVASQKTEHEFSFKSLFVPFTTFKAIQWIIFIGLIVYANMLFNGFVWDDKTFILFNSDIHTINIPFLFARNSFNNAGQYRPISAVYFAALYSLFSDSTFFYHILQVSIHIANTILLFLLFKNFLNKQLAFFLALIFLVHPIQVESVSYIAQTPSVLFFLFGIVALLLGQRKMLNVKVIPFIFFLLFCSVLTKEAGIIFIFPLLLYQYLFKNKSIFQFSLISAGVIIVYLFFRFFIGNVAPYTSAVVPIDILSLPQRLLNIPAVMFYYLKTFFYPAQLVIDQVWIIKSATFSNFYLPLLFISIFFILIIAGGIYLKSRKSQLLNTYLYFLTWFILGLVPYLQIYPIDGTVADRWFYFSMVGLLGLFGMFLQEIYPKRKKLHIGFIALGIIIVFSLSVRTIIRNMDWVNAITLYTHDSQILDSYNIEANLSTELRSEGKTDDALVHMQKSVALLPYEINLNNLGSLYEQKGDVQNAKKYYLLAMKGKSHHYPFQRHDELIYINVINFLIKNKDLNNANYYEKLGLQDYPQSQKLWLLKAFLEEKLLQHTNAIQAAQKANMIQQTQYSQEIYDDLLNNKPIDSMYQ